LNPIKQSIANQCEKLPPGRGRKAERSGRKVRGAMASRSISAILWTLVSVNMVTLVVGGLVTWLGYAIPVR